MNVLVIGATGFIGSHLVRKLTDRGHTVTALSRHATSADLPEGVRAYDGDVTDYQSIEGAFEGQDGVVFLPALSPLFKPRGGNVMHDKIHYGGTENALAAAEKHGVERFVHMSNLGASPDGRTAYMRAKGRAEERVTESDREWVVFRPSIVFGDGGEFIPFTRKLTTPYLAGLPGGGKTPFQPIWIGDFAPMIADALEEDEHVGQVYDIGGPEVYTLAEVAKLAHRANGRPVSILPIPMALAKLGAALAGPLPFIPFGPDQVRALKYDNRVTDNGITAFDVEPGNLLTLPEYLGLTEASATVRSKPRAEGANQ